MARRRKSKNNTTKYVIIGVAALVVIFLLMNVAPTGEYYKAQPAEEFPPGDDFEPGEGMFMQEEDGSFLCYTFESELTESCVVKDDLAMPEAPCNCFPEEMPGEREEPREEMPMGDEEGPEEFEEPAPVRLY